MKVSFIGNSIKVFFMILLLISILEYHGYVSESNRPSDYLYSYTTYKEKISNIEKSYGLNIKFSIIEKEKPDDWNNFLPEQNNISGLKSRVKKTKSLRSILPNLKLYPSRVLKKNLNYLYLLDHIILRGAEISATYNMQKKSIYIATKEESIISVGKSFHHELSSILIKNYHLREETWRNAAGEKFQYEKDKNIAYGWLYLRGKVEPVAKETLFKRGLLNQYSETGFENDFNTYAEFVFTEPNELKNLISKYPIIKRKYEVFKAFYLSIDDGFQPVFDKIDS